MEKLYKRTPERGKKSEESLPAGLVEKSRTSGGFKEITEYSTERLLIMRTLAG